MITNRDCCLSWSRSVFLAFCLFPWFPDSKLPGHYYCSYCHAFHEDIINMYLLMCVQQDKNNYDRTADTSIDRREEKAAEGDQGISS